MKKFVVLILCVLASYIALAQNNTSREFVDGFYDVEYYMSDEDYMDAFSTLHKLEEMDPTNANIWFKLGVCYTSSSKERAKAVEYLEKAKPYININYDETSPFERTAPIETNYYLGIALRKLRMYSESIDAFNETIETIHSNNLDEIYADFLKTLEEEIQISNNAIDVAAQTLGNKSLYTNVGSVINSKYSDHSPVVVCDGETLYFTSKRPNSISKKDGLEKIYVSKKENGKWGEPEILPSPVNTAIGNESVISVTKDGKKIYFYRSKPNEEGSLFVSELSDDGAWGTPELLEFGINTKYRETHVAVSPDENSLYFTSNRPGGYGGLDIYVIRKLPNGKWTEPILLPETINTPKDEESPFIHPNGSAMFFSSRGHNTIGGYDVFCAKFNEDGTFAEPVNMGTILNTSDDDVAFTLSCDGRTGYITAIRPDTYGEYDIYEYIQEDNSENNMVVYYGYVFYEDGSIPEDLSAQIKNADGKSIGTYALNKETGRYICAMDCCEKYDLSYQMGGFEVASADKTVTEWERDMYRLTSKPIVLDTVIIKFVYDDANIVMRSNNKSINDLDENTKNIVDEAIAKYKEYKLRNRQYTINLNYNPDDMNGNQCLNILNNYFKENGVDLAHVSYNKDDKRQNVYDINIDVEKVPETVFDVTEIQNVFFDFDKSNVKEEYHATLDVLAEYMKNNPTAKIEIAGHTDSYGSTDYNKKLSRRRADAVMNYLTSKGVAKDRFLIVTYGKSQPIAANDREDKLRKYNRRVQFRVVERGTKELKIAEIKVPGATTTQTEESVAPQKSAVEESSTESKVETSEVSSHKQENNSQAVDPNAKVYKVMILSLSNYKEPETIHPGVKVQQVNGFYRYYLGEFSTREEAQQALDGLNGAFPGALILESKAKN